jgi:hypothetical protein
MMKVVARQRRFRTVVALLGLGALSACNLFRHDHDHPEAEVHTMRLTFTGPGGTQTLNVTGASGENRSVTLGLGTTAVEATWIRADGTPDPIAHTTEFRLDATVQGTGVVWTPSATVHHAGTLAIQSPVTNVAVNFGLLHVVENHHDFGPFTVQVSAQ